MYAIIIYNMCELMHCYSKPPFLETEEELKSTWQFPCKSQYNYEIAWLLFDDFAPKELTNPFLVSPQRDLSKDSLDPFKGQATLRAE